MTQSHKIPIWQCLSRSNAELFYIVEPIQIPKPTEHASVHWQYSGYCVCLPVYKICTYCGATFKARAQAHHPPRHLHFRYLLLYSFLIVDLCKVITNLHALCASAANACFSMVHLFRCCCFVSAATVILTECNYIVGGGQKLCIELSTLWRLLMDFQLGLIATTTRDNDS